jgi:hypothetical protein
MNFYRKLIFLLLYLTIVQASYSQTTDVTIINFLSRERTPEIIIDYFDKLADRNFEIKVFKDSSLIYGNGANVVLMMYKKSGSGYLYINQTIENTMDNKDTRKVKYFLNKEVVDNCKTTKKLIRLKKKDVLSINIDDSRELSFISVYISVI